MSDTDVDTIEVAESVAEEADRLISYWERHNGNPYAVAKWAVADLLAFARLVAAASD